MWLVLAEGLEMEQRGSTLRQRLHLKQMELQLVMQHLEGGAQPASSPAHLPPWEQWEYQGAHCDCPLPSAERVRQALRQLHRIIRLNHFTTESMKSRRKVKNSCTNVQKIIKTELREVKLSSEVRYYPVSLIKLFEWQLWGTFLIVFTTFIILLHNSSKKPDCTAVPVSIAMLLYAVILLHSNQNPIQAFCWFPQATQGTGFSNIDLSNWRFGTTKRLAGCTLSLFRRYSLSKLLVKNVNQSKKKNRKRNKNEHHFIKKNYHLNLATTK